jgi:hypothetical protein
MKIKKMRLIDLLRIEDIQIWEDPIARRQNKWGWYAFVKIDGAPTIHTEVSISKNDLTHEYADRFLDDVREVFYNKLKKE